VKGHDTRGPRHQESIVPKYLLLKHVSELLEENGEYVDAQALTPARTCVRYGGPDAAPVTTDGPPRDQRPRRGLVHELSSDLPAAATAYADAVRRATDVAERDNLVRQAARARAAEPCRNTSHCASLMGSPTRL
jgi:hypothetical protein